MERQDIQQFHKIKISKPCKLWAQEKCPYEDEDCWFFHQDLTCPHYFFHRDCKYGSSCYFSLATNEQDITQLSKKDKIIFVQTQQINELTSILQQKEHELQILHSKHSQPTLESLGTTKSRRDAPPAFSNEASPAGMKTPGSRSSSIKNWILLPKVGGEIQTSLLKSPTIAIHNRKKWGDED